MFPVGHGLGCGGVDMDGIGNHWVACNHLSGAVTETVWFTYSRIPHLAIWKEWVLYCPQCLTGEGDQPGQPFFRRRPPFPDWIHFQPARVDADVDRFPLRWRYRRSRPDRVPFPPLTAKQTENHLFADRLFLHRL